MTVEQRLERLERQNGRLKWTFAVLVGLAAVGCVMGLKGQSEQPLAAPVPRDVPEVIQAQRFEVIGPNGTAIVQLDATKEGSGVVFTRNKKGRLVVQLGATEDGTGVVWTYNKKGRLLRP